jgi:aminodeoxyfutalosine synthase
VDREHITGLARRAGLEQIWEKVRGSERLTAQDAVTLLESRDLLAVGALASDVGPDAYFICNRHINHTNVCRNRCLFCAFSHEDGDAEAYTLSIDQVLDKARESLTGGVTEIHIVGGENPGLPYSYYLEMLRGLKELAPSVHIQAFTASEIVYLAGLAGKPVEDVLVELKQAGLGSLPGGGAEIFAGRVRDLVCNRKISGEQWLNVMRAAHRTGLKSNATMLYGHIETPAEVADHLLRLRDLQDETEGFNAFIPLSFQPANTQLADLPGPSGYDDLLMLAVSRLVLDNFRHIKAFWINVGLKLAQVSLAFGVDDLDGTVVEEKISHAAGVDTGQVIERDELVRVIRAAGRVPVERDTLYNVVRRYDEAQG